MWSGPELLLSVFHQTASLVTGRPTGTNLFVGAAVYLSTPCASQWH